MVSKYLPPIQMSTYSRIRGRDLKTSNALGLAPGKSRPVPVELCAGSKQIVLCVRRIAYLHTVLCAPFTPLAHDTT